MGSSRLSAGAAAVVLAILPLTGAASAAPASGARTATTNEVVLENLTWTEVRDALRAGMTTIIVPVGGVEQSGPYVALGKHDRRVALLSVRIARALGNALVAPVVAYVPEGSIAPPEGHMRFPGTLTVPDEVFEATLESAAESFRAHGFTDVVLLGDHGGYQRDLQAVVERLRRRWGSDGAVRVHVIPEYYRARGGHAGRDDTALTLATAPSMVRLRALRAAARPGASDGVYGEDPRGATAARGRTLADAQVAAAVAAIRRAVARPRRAQV